MEPMVMTEMDDRLARYEAGESHGFGPRTISLDVQRRLLASWPNGSNRALLIATAARHAQASIGNLPVQRRLRTGSQD